MIPEKTIEELISRHSSLEKDLASGKVDKKPEVDINVDAQGKVISNAKDRAAAWFEFLKNKFAATQNEQARPPMAPLQVRDPENMLQVEEIMTAVRSLKNHKAVGADGIPVEIYKVSSSAFKPV